MKIEANGKAFEFTVDGKPLDEKGVFEAFITLGSTFFPFAVVTRGISDEAPVRAVTFATDEDYVDKLVDCMEGELGDDEEIGVLGLETAPDESVPDKAPEDDGDIE